MKILRNRIKTPDGTILESKHRHDYVTYKDKNGHTYMVDGGTDYLRRSVNTEAPYIEMDVYDDETHETRRENMLWGTNYNKNKERLPETVYKPICDLDTDHIEAIIKDCGGISKLYLDTFKKELELRKNDRA